MSQLYLTYQSSNFELFRPTMLSMRYYFSSEGTYYDYGSSLYYDGDTGWCFQYMSTWLKPIIRPGEFKSNVKQVISLVDGRGTNESTGSRKAQN